MDSTEITHLLISWFTLSLAFSIDAAYVGLPNFLTKMPIVLIGLGTGFIFHELAHRAVAKRYGCWAVFRMWTWGLLLALGMAIMTAGSFLFAAPGAVYIGGRHLSAKENGIISLAGPATNILVGSAFLLLFFYSLTLGGFLGGFLVALGWTGAFVNFFLGFFNLIPIGPLDGSKVFQWNPTIWVIAIAIPGLFIFFFRNVILSAFT